MTPPIRIIIEKIKKHLDRVMPHDAQVILFGSRARGDYSEKSDWDLLVLLNRDGSLSVKDLGRLCRPLYELGAELDIDVNPVIYTIGDWQKRDFTPFYKNATSEGIKIWG